MVLTGEPTKRPEAKRTETFAGIPPVYCPLLGMKFDCLPLEDRLDVLRRSPLFTATTPFLLLEIEMPDNERGETCLVTGVREINGKLRVTGLGGGLTPFVEPAARGGRTKTWLNSAFKNLSREALEELTEGEGFLTQDQIKAFKQAIMAGFRTPEAPHTTVRIIDWKGRLVIDTFFFPPAGSVQPPREVSKHILEKARNKDGIVLAKPFDVIDALQQTAKRIGIAYKTLYEGPLAQRLPLLLRVAKEVHEHGLILTQDGQARTILPPIGFTVADAVMYILSIVHYVDVNERANKFSPPGIIYQDNQAFAFGKVPPPFTCLQHTGCPNTGLQIPPQQELTLEGFFLDGTPTRVRILPETFQWAHEVYNGFLQVTEVLETAHKLTTQFATNPESFWEAIINPLGPSYPTWFNEKNFLETTKRYLNFLTSTAGASEEEKARLYQKLAHKISMYLHTLGFALDSTSRSIETVEDFLEFLKTIKNQIRKDAPSTAEEHHVWWTLWLLIFVPFTEAVLHTLFTKVIEKPKGLKKLTPFIGLLPPFNPKIEYFRLNKTQNPRGWQILQEKLTKLLQQITTDSESEGGKGAQVAPFSPISTQKT